MGLKPLTWHAWKVQNGSKRWYWRLPLAIEWGLEWFVYRLRSLALFDLLELAGRCTVLVVAIFWVLEADNRAKERHYRAWDLINSARGSTGDGGRINALQDLNKDRVSLAAAPLEQAYLAGVDLQGATLEYANLQGVQALANLQDANLRLANLERAILMGANLQGANLWRANLRVVNLLDANLQGADLQDADLQNANLGLANLRDAHLQSADLQGANLGHANLQGAKTSPRSN